jgi:hypothetical protein
MYLRRLVVQGAGNFTEGWNSYTYHGKSMEWTKALGYGTISLNQMDQQGEIDTNVGKERVLPPQILLTLLTVRLKNFITC